MKLVDHNHGFEGNLPEERIAFKIQNSAKLFNILSSGIYEDKILAVIRELSCNAFDAHIDAGKRDVPFVIKVPNVLEATFSITDQGTGIDPLKISDIFWTYGASTKADSNEFIGALGLGSKSPFAYTKSSFTVKNRYKGIEYHYLCFVNEDGKPDGSKLAEIPTNEQNGLTIEFAVRQNDVTAFIGRIQRFFSTWSGPLPIFEGGDVKIPMPVKIVEGRTWYLQQEIYGASNRAIALMGNVPYPINADAIPNLTEGLELICNNRFVLKIPMGALNFAASREGLEYDERTCTELVKLLEIVRAEIVANFKDKIFKAKTLIEFLHLFRTEFNSFKKSFVIANNPDDSAYLNFLFGKTLKDSIDFSGESYLLEDLITSKFTRTVPGITQFGIYEVLTKGSSIKLTPLTFIELKDLIRYELKTSYFSYSHRTGVTVENPMTVSGHVGNFNSYNWTVPKTRKNRSYQTTEMMTQLVYAQSDQSAIESKTRVTFKVTNDKNVMIIINDLGAVGVHRTAAYINKHQRENKIQFLFAQNPDIKDDFTGLVKNVREWAGASKFGIDVHLISELADEREKIEVENDAKDLIKVPVSVWGMRPNGAHVPKDQQAVLEFSRLSGYGAEVNISATSPMKLSVLKAQSRVFYTIRNRSRQVLDPDGQTFCLNKYESLEFIREEKLYEELFEDGMTGIEILNLTESQAEGLKKRGVKLTSIGSVLTASVAKLAKKENLYAKYFKYRAMYLGNGFDSIQTLFENHFSLRTLVKKSSPLHEIFNAIAEREVAYSQYEDVYERVALFSQFIEAPKNFEFTKQWNFDKLMARNYPLLQLLLRSPSKLDKNNYNLIANYINQCDIDMGNVSGDEISEVVMNSVIFEDL